MEIINITEEQKNNLCDELARLTFEFKENEKVDCVYFAPYKGLGEIRGNVLELTLVTKDGFKECNKSIDECNQVYQKGDSLRKFGVKIVIDVEDEKKYTTMDLNPSEVKRSNNLFNSIILFDRTGKYTEIKEQIEKCRDGKTAGIFYYENLAEIVPPITNGIYKSMDIIQMKKDTDAVKEFTKSKLFKNIIDM